MQGVSYMVAGSNFSFDCRSTLLVSLLAYRELGCQQRYEVRIDPAQQATIIGQTLDDRAHMS